MPQTETYGPLPSPMGKGDRREAVVDEVIRGRLPNYVIISIKYPPNKRNQQKQTKCAITFCEPNRRARLLYTGVSEKTRETAFMKK